MAEEIPWDVMKDSLSSFAHDSLNVIQMGLNAFTRAAHTSKLPELDLLVTDAFKTGQAIRDLHFSFAAFRYSKEEPKNIERVLLEYRRQLKKRNQKFMANVAKIKKYCTRNWFLFDNESKEVANRGFQTLKRFNDFPAEAIGKKVFAEPMIGNIFDFLKSFSKEKFFDRDGNEVKIIFNGKNVGGVKFDRKFLRRGLENLVTDALNHSPGRPIFVTLSGRTGRAVINVTNHGPKLLPEEIQKIGRVRFTRAWSDPKRGYGKISTRLLTEAQGGTFHARNSRIGPMLTLRFPIAQRHRKIAA